MPFVPHAILTHRWMAKPVPPDGVKRRVKTAGPLCWFLYYLEAFPEQPIGSNQWSKLAANPGSSSVHSQSKPCLWICESPTLQTQFLLAPHPSIISNFADFHCQFCQSFPPKHLMKHDLFQNKTKKKTLIRVFFYQKDSSPIPKP